ncbi:MAG: SEC-C metal-binding domain-containing protein [Planctomycetota bacterium]
MKTSSSFEPISKRKKGFPSETNVKRGVRIVHGNKELIEKLGRNDRCPCGSNKSFQAMLHEERQVRRHES